MDNQTSKAFWDATKISSPTVYDKFLTWIDEYKKIVNWQNIFAPDIKFHDLPFEMQLGVISKFIESTVDDDGSGNDVIEKVAKEFMPAFVMMEMRYRIESFDESKK